MQICLKLAKNSPPRLKNNEHYSEIRIPQKFFEQSDGNYQRTHRLNIEGRQERIEFQDRAQRIETTSDSCPCGDGVGLLQDCSGLKY